MSPSPQSSCPKCFGQTSKNKTKPCAILKTVSAANHGTVTAKVIPGPLLYKSANAGFCHIVAKILLIYLNAPILYFDPAFNVYRAASTAEGFANDVVEFGVNFSGYAPFFSFGCFSCPKTESCWNCRIGTHVIGFNLWDFCLCFQEEPKKVCFTYDLFLNLEGNPPVNHLRCEKLTFNNPTKEFRHKLIKAGGVSN